MRITTANWTILLVALLGVLLALSAQSGDARGKERIVDLPLSSGQHQRVLYSGPPSPRATIIMFPGGAGEVGLTQDGDIRHSKNFVVRTREMCIARGYAVLVPDRVDRESLRGMRSSPEYAAIVGDLIRYARAQSSAPVFLLGTSQGSIAAANGAGHAAPDTLAGVILTESVSVLGGSHETVFDANLSDIRVPALIIANKDDRCNVAPPENAAKIAAAMAHAPEVKVVEVEGGIDRSGKACGSLSPHGYYGIEEKVVGIISAWIERHFTNAAPRKSEMR